MENESVFNTFAFLSKLIIIVPVAVVIIGLIIKFNQKPNRPKHVQLVPSPTITISPTPKQPLLKIDLTGPLVCRGDVDGSSTTVYIKNKKIKLILKKNGKTENMLLSGDCFYNWSEGEYNGKRICGLSPLISIAETMTKIGGVGGDFLLGQLRQFGLGGSIATNQAQLQSLVSSCTQGKIADATFQIPERVLFKNNN